MTTPVIAPKKLIEVALPLDAINTELRAIDAYEAARRGDVWSTPQGVVSARGAGSSIARGHVRKPSTAR